MAKARYQLIMIDFTNVEQQLIVAGFYIDISVILLEFVYVEDITEYLEQCGCL